MKPQGLGHSLNAEGAGAGRLLRFDIEHFYLAALCTFHVGSERKDFQKAPPAIPVMEKVGT